MYQFSPSPEALRLLSRPTPRPARRQRHRRWRSTDALLRLAEDS